MNNPDIPKVEQGNERIPTREEVLAQIQKRCEGAKVVHELSDAEGVYLIEASEVGQDFISEYTLYVYQRKGNFQTPGNNYQASATTLEAVYYSKGRPCGGDTIADYDSTTGAWVEK